MIDIFRDGPQGALWLGTAEGMAEARASVKKLYALNPGKYFTFEVSTQTCSILKTSFALSQLNLHGRNDSLQTLCLRSFSRCSLQFAKDFDLALRFKRR